AFGIVLYELLSGRVPFYGESFSEICMKVGIDAVPPLVLPSGANPNLERVIRRCLEKDRAARFPNVAALAESLVPFSRPHVRYTASGVGPSLSSAAVGLRAEASASPLPDPTQQSPASPGTLTGSPAEVTRAPGKRGPRHWTWAVVGGVAVAVALAALALVVNAGRTIGQGPAGAGFVLPVVPEAAATGEPANQPAAVAPPPVPTAGSDR